MNNKRIKSLKFSSCPISEVTYEIESGIIQIPDIQRGLVWSDEQKTKLLYTLINKFPYGAIILGKIYRDYNNNDKDYKFIIDGLQRTTTMLDIYYNPFRYIDDNLEKEILNDFVNEYIQYYKGHTRNEPCEEDVEKLKNIGKKMIKNTKNSIKIDNLPWDDALNSNYFNFYDFDEYNIKKIFNRVYTEFKDNIFSSFQFQIQEFIGSEDDISEIFQVINEQGKPLTDIEILKSKLAKYKIYNEFEKKNEILNFKNKFFENILQNYKFKNNNSSNNISIFDYLFYIVYNIFKNNEMRVFKESPLLEEFEKNVDNNKSKNINMEWFKIVRFILNILYGYNGNIESIIINFYNYSQNNDVNYQEEIHKINNLILKAFNKINDVLIFPKYKYVDTNKKLVKKSANRNFKFNKSESFLLIATFMKLINKDDNNKLIYNNIFKHIVKYAQYKPFSSSSYEKAFSYFLNDDMISNINISDCINHEAELNDEDAILKIITPLILLKKDSCKYLYYTKIFNDDIFNKIDILERKDKKSFEKSLSNFFVFLSDNEELFQSSFNIFNDYFYQKSTNENLKNNYKNMLQHILTSNELTIDDLKKFKKLRIDLLFSEE